MELFLLPSLPAKMDFRGSSQQPIKKLIVLKNEGNMSLFIHHAFHILPAQRAHTISNLLQRTGIKFFPPQYFMFF